MTLVMLAALLTTASASNIPGDMLLGNFNEQAGGGVNHHHQSASLTSLTSLDNLKPPDAKVNSSAYIAHHLYFAKPQIGPGEGINMFGMLYMYQRTATPCDTIDVIFVSSGGLSNKMGCTDVAFRTTTTSLTPSCTFTMKLSAMLTR
jgi:hypothetical protein